MATTPRTGRAASLPPPVSISSRSWISATALTASVSSLPTAAHAAFLSGDALDTAADIMSWIVLFVAPIIALAVFWIVHILPEKIAEKKQHPQTSAIQCLCLLSLVFGGLLWPIAWLWAYTKPVLYKRAYGVDKVPHGHEDAVAPEADAAAAEEIRVLRQRLVELETRLGSRSSAATAGT